jgi:hypothetical protein
MNCLKDKRHRSAAFHSIPDGVNPGPRAPQLKKIEKARGGGEGGDLLLESGGWAKMSLESGAEAVRSRVSSAVRCLPCSGGVYSYRACNVMICW